jgi:hypothetical protein
VTSNSTSTSTSFKLQVRWDCSSRICHDCIPPAWKIWGPSGIAVTIHQDRLFTLPLPDSNRLGAVDMTRAQQTISIGLLVSSVGTLDSTSQVLHADSAVIGVSCLFPAADPISSKSPGRHHSCGTSEELDFLVSHIRVAFSLWSHALS